MGGSGRKGRFVGIGLLVLGAIILAAAPGLLLSSSPETRQEPGALVSQAGPMAPNLAASTPAAPVPEVMGKTMAQNNHPKELVKEGFFNPSPSAVRSRTARGQTILDAPPFNVESRKEVLEFYPCSDCHEDEEPNPIMRELEEEHSDLVLDHGGGRFWCLTCHRLEDRNNLASLMGKPIDFDTSYLLCGQCHFQRQKDWYFGGHGKRVGTWQGSRVIQSCPECHDAHSPSIKPFEPAPPPVARKGLIHAGAPAERHFENWEIRAIELGGRK